MMYGREKSGSAIVAGKPTQGERSAAEPVEPRAEAKGNAGQQSTHRAQYRERVSKALVQVNDLSRSLAVFDPISTLVVVVEMSKASWLVSERRCSW